MKRWALIKSVSTILIETIAALTDYFHEPNMNIFERLRAKVSLSTKVINTMTTVAILTYKLYKITYFNTLNVQHLFLYTFQHNHNVDKVSVR